jgi:uncharacterized sulfatase
MRDTKDFGLLPEPELLERMRPGGKWAVTAKPEVTKTGKLVAATCITPGASIVYSQEEGKTPRWKLYVQPFEPVGGRPVRFLACRLGYRNSEEVTL